MYKSSDLRRNNRAKHINNNQHNHQAGRSPPEFKLKNKAQISIKIAPVKTSIKPHKHYI